MCGSDRGGQTIQYEKTLDSFVGVKTRLEVDRDKPIHLDYRINKSSYFRVKLKRIKFEL